ncbi:MAG: beta-lactamase family protein [Cyanobacteria bacterium SZAS LIN-2]|nr:beta-lactamase family protein [Cyanobacteria bacterium SZAS LIN-3]MBS1996917.1 beta-lactamase family protein [Cyanobacteria bacterium SZAS LIN-2]
MIDKKRLERLYARIDADIAEGKYPGAAVAMASGGEVIAERVFGVARLAQDGAAPVAADAQTLWLLYSQTKPITSAALLILAERGLLNLHFPVAHYIPEFSKHSKGGVTAFHLLTHQAGFPNAMVTEAAWADHKLLQKEVCDFPLDFEPGSKVFYHSYAAHWVQAVLIEAVTGQDFRKFIASEVIEPLGLSDMYVGVPEDQHKRLAGSYYCEGDGLKAAEHKRSDEFDNTAFYLSGMPGAGCYATARDVALFYQMLIGLGQLRGKRILSPRMVQYMTTNHTGDRPDEFFGAPMHRALGVHLRGKTPTIRGLSSIAHPDVFGHGGVGTSYSFADPHSGVSFTYLTNSRLPEPGHGKRLDEIMTMAQAAVVGL